jgi:hypothetical protein
MAEQRKSRGFDPLQGLRELLDKGERSLNEALAQRSTSDRTQAVRSGLSRILLDAQRRNWELWGRWFRTINVPTRSDVIRLGKTLTQLEQRMSQIESGLRRLERRNGAEEARPAPARAASDRPRPARTRLPPSRAGETAR